MRFLAFAITLILFGSSAHAQRAQVYTVLMRSGSEIVKILVEKRADLTVGVVSGAIVAVMDKSMASIFEDKKDTDSNNIFILNCSRLNSSMATCKDPMTLPGEKPLALDDARIRTAMGGAQSTLLFPVAKPGVSNPTLAPPPPAPPVAVDRSLLEVTFWWSIQSSQFAADFEDYLKKFPNGEFTELAKRRIAELKVAPPEAPVGSTVESRVGCSSDRRALVTPVNNLYEALRTRNSARYAAQWWDDASYRSYDGSIHLNKYELVADRQYLFGKWVDVRISNVQMSAAINRQGMAVVRSTYDFYARDIAGRVDNVPEVESFLLACFPDGSWKILDSVYYPN